MKPADAFSRLSTAFSQALVTTLTALTGKTFSLTSSSAGPFQAGREWTVWQQEIRTVQGRISGILSLATGTDFSRAAGHMTLEAAGVTNGSAEEIRAAWHGLAGQIFSRLVASLNAELGSDLTLSPGNEVPYDDAGPWTEIGIQEPGSVYRMLFSAPPSLAGLFTTGPANSTASLSAGSGTFDLLLDVALPVAVSFGRTALQIREVLKLNSGSVIELNRLVSEPVDVVVNNSVIARGEVVVVDGNYGVRITQIASREDRIRTGMNGDGAVPSGVAA